MPKISNSIQTAFFTVLFIFFFLLVFTKVFGPIPFAVNSVTTTKSDLFTVNGEGEATAVPDTAMVSMGISQTAATVEQAKDKANGVMNKIATDLKNLGVAEKDIKTVNYNVYPNREFSGRNDISGYTVSQDLQVTVREFDKANKAVDLATADGANQVGGIQFVLNDDKREQLEQQARAEAIKKAKAKASDIAGAAGIKLGRIVNINESNSSQRPPVMYEKAMDLQAGSAANPTELQPGENTVRVSVSLSYETF
jgi:uncharacterized protein